MGSKPLTLALRYKAVTTRRSGRRMLKVYQGLELAGGVAGLGWLELGVRNERGRGLRRRPIRRPRCSRLPGRRMPPLHSRCVPKLPATHLISSRRENLQEERLAPTRFEAPVLDADFGALHVA